MTPDEIAGNLNNSLAVIDQANLKANGAAAALAGCLPTTKCTNGRPTGNGVYYQSNVNAQGFPSGPVYQSPRSTAGLRPSVRLWLGMDRRKSFSH